jgi:hypothetical protein
MRLGRTCPDLDSHLFFDPDEIRRAYLLTKVRRPAQPKLNEVSRLIARLGGFLGRKGTANPVRKRSGPDSEEFLSPQKQCACYETTTSVVYNAMALSQRAVQSDVGLKLFEPVFDSPHARLLRGHKRTGCDQINPVTPVGQRDSVISGNFSDYLLQMKNIRFDLPMIHSLLPG